MSDALKSCLKRVLPLWLLGLYSRWRRCVPRVVYQSVLPPALHIPHNAYAGRRCFIVGSGPSIAGMNLSHLQNEICMVVNKGFLLAERGLPRAEFYGLSDVNAAREYSTLIPSGFARHVCIFGAIPWARADLNSDLSVFSMYSENDKSRFMSSGFFQFDLSQPVAHTYTVVLQMLQVAVHAGFSDIYFIGVDNNFSGANMHFYTDSRQEKRNMVQWGLDPCPDNEKAFAMARELLEPRGIKLYNAGVGGSLQALPRVDFEGLFK